MANSVFFKHVIAVQMVVIAINIRMLLEGRVLLTPLSMVRSRSIDRMLDTTQVESDEAISTEQNMEEPEKLAGDPSIAPPKSPTITFLFAGGDPSMGSGTKEDVKVMRAMMGYAMMSRMPRTEDNEPITEDIINRNIDGLRDLVDILMKAGASQQDMVNLATVLTANGKTEVPRDIQQKILNLLLDKRGMFKKYSKQMEIINDIANSDKQLRGIPIEEINNIMLKTSKWTDFDNPEDEQKFVEHEQHQKQSSYDWISTNGFPDQGNFQLS